MFHSYEHVFLLQMLKVIPAKKPLVHVLFLLSPCQKKTLGSHAVFGVLEWRPPAQAKPDPSEFVFPLGVKVRG